MKRMFFKLTCLLFLLALNTDLKAQLSVVQTSEISDIVQTYFKLPGEEISNISYSGDLDKGLGVFYEPSGVLGMKFGVLISTGPVEYATGFGNLRIGKVPENGHCEGGTNYLLNEMDSTQVFDVQQISFDIIPNSTSINFNYVFGSEEYNASVGTGYNDRMAIFISGPNIIGDSNIALVNNDYVSINTVNEDTNEDYFLEQLGANIEFSRRTTRLTSSATVIPGQKYSMKIIIGDAKDRLYNSGLFISRCDSICSNNIEEKKEIEYTVYPNPSNGNFKLILNNPLEATIRLLDISGRLIESTFVHAYYNKFNFESIPSGIYTLIIESVRDTKSTKIVIN